MAPKCTWTAAKTTKLNIYILAMWIVVCYAAKNAAGVLFSALRVQCQLIQNDRLALQSMSYCKNAVKYVH